MRPFLTLVNASMEWMMILTEDMAKIRELLESNRSIDHLDYSVKISKLAREVQRLSGLVEAKNL